MKVRDLKVGMMIRPIINKWTDRRMNLKVTSVKLFDKPGDEIHSGTGLFCDITCSPPRDRYQPNVGIYMGVKNSSQWMMGVKKHHQILVGGTLASLSGYDVRYLEAVVKNENKE